MTTATSITLGNWTGHLGRGLAIRELQCVLGIAMGQTSKELARDLGVQPESIKKRVLSAGTKLGVTRRAQLVAEALRRQIIAPSVMALIALLTTHAMLGDNQINRIRRPGEGRIETRVAYRRIEAALTA